MRIQEQLSNPPSISNAISTSNGISILTKAEIQKTNAQDISSIVMDDEANKGQGKTVKDVMQEAGNVNVATLRDYMTVMSNFMSDDDYAALIKDGKKPGSMDAEEMVTSLDKIKATLAEAGVNIKGFTDTLDRKTLEGIYGSLGEISVEGLLRQKDVALTSDNMSGIAEALEKGKELTTLSEQTKVYILKNSTDLTIDSLYKAQYSGGNQSIQRDAQCYLKDQNGYISKKADSSDFSSVEEQVMQIIEDAGLEINEKSLTQAKWILSKGLPLTNDIVKKYQVMEDLRLPLQEKKLLELITNAVANGKEAGETQLNNEVDYRQEAIRIQHVVDSIIDDSVLRYPMHEKITLQNLQKFSWESQSDDLKASAASNIRAMRQMEEIRLSMSVSANYHLLRTGFSIETEDLENVVEALNIAEKELAGATTLTKEEFSSYQEILDTKTAIMNQPIAAIGRLLLAENRTTLQDINFEGTKLAKMYMQANESYETLQTEVRSDLGDSIQKAFSNAESLLQEMGLESTQANLKAVRILGYNRMEITDTQVALMKEANRLVSNCLEKLTPNQVLNFIKDQINPLEMNMQELEETLDSYDDSDMEVDRYARFLRTFESKNEIDQEQREAYIGIHRLLHQIEKSDGAAIGALVQQGQEITLRNMLTAIRSEKKQGMDFKLSEKSSGVEKRSSEKKTISDQIENYFQKLVIKAADQMLVSDPATLQIDLNVSLEAFSESLEQTKKIYDGTSELISEEAGELREHIKKSEDTVLETLQAYDLNITPDHIQGLSDLLLQNGQIFRNLQKNMKNLSDEIEFEEQLDVTLENIAESFVEPEEIVQSYENLTTFVRNTVQMAMDNENTTFVDFKALSLLYKQFSLASDLAKEENYEVPIKIGEQITSMNLKILHQGNEQGKVCISMMASEQSKIMGEFQYSHTNGEEVRGYLATNDVQTEAYLSSISSTMELVLSDQGKTSVRLDVFVGHISDKARLTNGLSEVKNSKEIRNQEIPEEKVTTRKLYEVAKSFINAVQEAYGGY